MTFLDGEIIDPISSDGVYRRRRFSLNPICKSNESGVVVCCLLWLICSSRILCEEKRIADHLFHFS